ncbi:MAG: tyrosine--tRNA ligase [Candidatus Levybacteria bacterium]|nr:tyrosine--tRNA ligase [Candidatus Levybacteria bacterium]
MDELQDLLTRGVINVIPNSDLLKKKLEAGVKLNIYMGIDPTATKIHLGHAVPLRKLQKFAEMGHTVTFLIGDFTALIGDTSDKESERPILTSEQIQENFRLYKEQASKIIDFSKVSVRHNSEWLSKLTFADIVKLCQHFSFGDFASRELIKKRLTEGKKVGLHEALYPVMQGYDSYELKTDIQIGGADQTFNMQAGRELIKDLEGRESFVLATDYLIGTDGRKMSKTWGNAIWLEDNATDMFGKVMSLKDDLILDYFLLATDTTYEEIEGIKKRLEASENPMILKKELALKIVTELHNADEAARASENFQHTVQDKELPDDLQEFEVNSPTLVIDFLTNNNLIESKSDVKRLMQAGAVKFDKTPSQHDNLIIKDGILEFGKRKAVKIKFTGNEL